MAEWISETFTSETGWQHLETLVDIGNRMAGSEGERRAAEITQDRLVELGLRNVHLEHFDLQGWTRGWSEIRIGNHTEDCIALPRSPTDSARGQLVNIGHGLPADFSDGLDGTIVMASSDVPDWFDRYIHRREKYYKAVESGATAFIYQNHVEGCLPPTGSVGTEKAPIGAIPAVGVSKEVGSRLARRWEDEEVTVEVEADIHQATSQNIHADIGPNTESEILLTSHIDAHDIAEGASDNGAGTALVMEVAKALVAREEELDTRVHVIVFGAEEVGLVGSGYDASQRELETVKAVVNNDGVVRGRTLEFTTNGFDALEELTDSVGDPYDYPVNNVPQMGIHSDHWPYVQWGVPGYHVMSQTDYEGRGWGHTAADTLDKLDVRDLREQAIFLTDLIVALADETVEIDRRDPEEIADQLEAEDLAEGMQVIGDWPY